MTMPVREPSLIKSGRIWIYAIIAAFVLLAALQVMVICLSLNNPDPVVESYEIQRR